MENKFIAYCGLNCETCDARLATINNDFELKKKTAELWSKWNGVEFKPEDINCVGCKMDGPKPYFCQNLCDIKKCAIEKEMVHCGKCNHLESCQKIKMIIDHNDDAKNNLKK